MSMNEHTRPLEILLIEDNRGDAFLISSMLNETELPLRIKVVEDGRQAIELLNEPYCSGLSSIPDFVILDLNLPKVHGFEILAFIKARPTLCSIPVAIMTGSLNREDEARARSMGVIDYRIKPSLESELDSTTKWLKKNLAPLVEGKQRSANTDGTGVSIFSDMMGSHIVLGTVVESHPLPNMNFPVLDAWSFKPFG